MELKVISFNLRYDKPDPGDHAWTVRKAAVAESIAHYAPDIIGTQEGMAHQLLDLHRLLPNYQSVGDDRTGVGMGERCAIFYRSGRLKCLNSGNFFLSDTPETPGSISPDWGNRVPRMTTWAVFAVVGEEETITVFNTHLDYNSAKARELGAKLVCDRISHLQPSESYTFLTGDFNAAPGSVPREMLGHSLPNGLHLYDALADIELEEQQTFHDFTGKAVDAVDTIYYDSRVSLRRIEIDHRQWLGVLPSDHFPVMAEFRSTGK
ncbi:MAG: endonuclease/exonuclease/phosphatase family protein [Kastovskya adunca ATA6-11-RM4]|jgi:endonuclease/exonuclease/phosphatase family metal-dependent hydrolase|nr:endonuclease/exonuclease/phosphatase family protein [Kastovskya adunca ATA6-11-RM4]